MNATCRLMQENGVKGPVETITVPDLPEDVDGPIARRDAICEAAIAWAGGQTGHPWDVLTITTDEWSSEIALAKLQ